ncbi:MAG: hypothetical protein Q9227_009349 [Pyrenula ochraceoflavens]
MRELRSRILNLDARDFKDDFFALRVQPRSYAVFLQHLKGFILSAKDGTGIAFSDFHRGRNNVFTRVAVDYVETHGSYVWEESGWADSRPFSSVPQLEPEQRKGHSSKAPRQTRSKKNISPEADHQIPASSPESPSVANPEDSPRGFFADMESFGSEYDRAQEEAKAVEKIETRAQVLWDLFNEEMTKLKERNKLYIFNVIRKDPCTPNESKFELVAAKIPDMKIRQSETEAEKAKLSSVADD